MDQTKINHKYIIAIYLSLTNPDQKKLIDRE